MNNNTAKNAEAHIKAIEGQIKGLVQSLSKLAPHPQGSAHNGAVFISLDSAFKPAAEYDGMAGSLLIDGFLSHAFADVSAANDNGVAAAACSIDYNTLEMAAHYAEDRDNDNDKTHNNYGRGRGSIALYERPPISKPFNEEANTAFSKDVDERKAIEAHIARLVDELDNFKQFMPMQYAA